MRVDLAHANFDYDVKGDAPFRPTLVFDDARFTYFQLPHNVRLPAVMVLDKHGEGEVTDLITLGNDFYKVPQVTEYGILVRRDQDEVRILNRTGSGNVDRSGRTHDSNAFANLYGKS